MGRNTWEEWQGNEKQNPALFTVVTSRTLRYNIVFGLGILDRCHISFASSFKF